MSAESEEYDSDADVEPTAAEAAPHIKSSSSRKAFSKLATELSDKDLSSPGVQKMLLAEISRLESLAIQSDEFRRMFHKVDKDCSVLQEKAKTVVFSEILYSVSLTLGAALIGIAPSVTSASYSPVIIGIIGTLLIFGAVVAKVVKK